MPHQIRYRSNFSSEHQIADLVDIVLVDDVVKGRPEVIKKIDDLHRRTFRRQSGEGDDVRKVDGHLFVELWQNGQADFKAVSN